MNSDPIKVLIVEDENEIRDSLEFILINYGFKVDKAKDGEVALEIIKQKKIDIIVCDVMMPRLNGYELLARVKGLNFDIPFIFLTAKVQYDDFRLGMDLGADDYLYKPFKAKDVINCIINRLEKKKNDSYRVQKLIDGLEGTIKVLVGHEFITPLHGIISFTDLIKKHIEELGKDDLTEFCTYLEISANRLKDLFLKLELYTALNAGAYINRNELECAKSEVIQQMAYEIASKYKRLDDLGIDLNNISFVPISPEILNIIINELVDNAFKFSIPETPINISIKESNQIITLEVRNRSNSVTIEQLRYQIGNVGQLNRGITEKQGIGLGLVIIDILTKQIGATLLVDDCSSYQQNICFKIVFPKTDEL